MRILEPHVERVIVVSPDDTGIAQRAREDRRLDARTLARLLWKGELEAVWMPDERCRVLRRRLARREQLVRARTRAKNEIHAVLQRRLQAKPPCSDLFGVKGRQWLAGWSCRSRSASRSTRRCATIEFLDAEIAEVERLIAQQALVWPEIRRLMTVPGVNLICAATFLAAIGDADRFMTSRKLVAYLGLDPQGPPVRRGAGAQRPDLQARLRRRAVGAGRSGVDSGLPARPAARVLRATRARRGHGKAIVATARKLAVPVLVHAHPRRGLRPPAAVADRARSSASSSSPPAPQATPRRPPGSGPTNRGDARSRARARRAKPRRPTSGWSTTGKPAHQPRKWARARHRSAHKLGPRRAKPRGRPKLLTSALRYVSHPRPPTT